MLTRSVYLSGTIQSTTISVLVAPPPQLCGSEEFWEQAVRGRWQTVPAEARPLAAELGWRRLFFTSKLQLQKLISRRRRRQQQQQQQQHGAEEQQQEEEGEGLIPQASGTPEAFWDGAGSSGANLSPAGTTTVTESSFDTESYSDSDSLSDPMPRESGSESSLVVTWP